MKYSQIRARICKPFKEPRNRFPDGTTTLLDVPARQATWEAGGVDSLESVPGLLKRLQILAQLGRWVVLRGGLETLLPRRPPFPPFLQHASELILKDDVNGFSLI